MSDEVLIKVENVGKKFCRSLKRSMLYGVEDIVRDTLSLKTTSDKLRPEEFWAVDDVSFEVRRGECLGIIGRNGAGKSTLLKMLNGIFMPDKGKITIKGKVGALIEVGAGFHPMLTGRENIYVNGAILGMSKREIDKKFDEIVAFAELEEFIDIPVKHYSSGMYIRLGFSIAIMSNVDILLIDESLSVGDIKFKAKCYNAISDFMQNGTIVFVSHNMNQINRICNHALYLSSKKNNYYGKANIAVQKYNSLMIESTVQVKRYGNAKVTLEKITINKQNQNIEVKHGQNFDIELTIYSKIEINIVLIVFNFRSLDGYLVAECNSQGNNFEVNLKRKTTNTFFIRIKEFSLNPGVYTLDALIMNRDRLFHYDAQISCKKIIVTGDALGTAYQQFVGQWNIINE